MVGWKQLMVEPLLESCSTSLLHLNIDMCTKFNDELINALATHCPNLSHFSWQHAERLSVEDFNMLILGKQEGILRFIDKPKPGCRNLQTVNLK